MKIEFKYVVNEEKFHKEMGAGGKNFKITTAALGGSHRNYNIFRYGGGRVQKSRKKFLRLLWKAHSNVLMIECNLKDFLALVCLARSRPRQCDCGARGWCTGSILGTQEYI